MAPKLHLSQYLAWTGPLSQDFLNCGWEPLEMTLYSADKEQNLQIEASHLDREEK